MSCVDALIRSGICTDRLGCAWEVSRHPLLIALVAWFLASWYQRRSKRWEFRANTLRDAASVYFRTMELVFALKPGKQAAGGPPQVFTTRGNEVRINLAAQGGPPSGRLGEAAALAPFVDLLFSRTAWKHWNDVALSLAGAMGEDDPKKIDELVKKAGEAYRKFIARAGKEVGARTLWRRATNLWRRLRARLSRQTAKP